MKKILVVDHDRSIRELLRLHLSNAGYEVLVAEDVVVAGGVILNCVPDLMIVEVDMPFMNGIEFVATLKADSRTRDIPIVFIGSNAEFDDLARGLGAVAFLTKPVYADRLLEIVDKRLRPKPRK
ncbi:MAG TPA: response regulator [Burkholderiales bacterium]|nr:response regulator [Burkholderiales bacterium]